MGVSLKREHVRSPEREQFAYTGPHVDPMKRLVIVQRKSDKYQFPRVNSPEVPFRGRLMGECFKSFEELTRTRYDLVFLYCTRNDKMSRGWWECIEPFSGV